MKIYLASRFANQERLKPIRDKLVSMGHVVTSEWLDEHNDAPRDAAIRDVSDIRRADVIVLWPDLNPMPTTTYGGMFFEFGLAYGLGKILVVVEPETSSSVFLHLDVVLRFASWTEFFNFVGGGDNGQAKDEQ